MLALNPHLIRHLRAIAAERDRQARQSEAFVSIRDMRDERAAQSVLYPPRRLEGRGTPIDPPRRGTA
jgi:hypothetical protein